MFISSYHLSFLLSIYLSNCLPVMYLYLSLEKDKANIKFVGNYEWMTERLIWSDEWRADSLEKTLMMGRIEGRRRRWWQRMRDGWMASLTCWTWSWANSESWWETGKPGMWQPMGSWRVGHNLATEQQQKWKTHENYLHYFYNFQIIPPPQILKTLENWRRK